MKFTRHLGLPAVALSLLTLGQSPWAAVSASAAPIVSAEPTSFEAVAKQLDPNGGFYFYLSSENFLKEASEKLTKMIPQLMSVGKMGAKEKAQAEMAWNALSKLGSASGIGEISGFGASSIALEKGYYKTKWMLHHYEGKGGGFMWNMSGNSASAMEIISYLPKKTAMTVSADMTLVPLWKAINDLAASNKDLQGALQMGSMQMEAGLGMKLDAVLAALGPNYSLVVTLDPSRKTTVPGPDKATMTIPEPALAICIQVQDEALLSRVEKEITKMPGVVSADKGDFKIRLMPSAVPLPFVRPVVAWKKGLVIISSQEALVGEMLAVKAGTSPGITSVPEFASMMKTMPTSACQFQFTAPILQETMIELQMTGMKQAAATDPAMAGLMNFFKPAVQPRWSCSTMQNTPTGWVGEIRGQSGAAEIVAVGAVVPVAMAAAIAMPAFAKTKERAKEAQAAAAEAQKALKEGEPEISHGAARVIDGKTRPRR